MCHRFLQSVSTVCTKIFREAKGLSMTIVIDLPEGSQYSFASKQAGLTRRALELGCQWHYWKGIHLATIRLLAATSNDFRRHVFNWLNQSHRSWFIPFMLQEMANFSMNNYLWITPIINRRLLISCIALSYKLSYDKNKITWGCYANWPQSKVAVIVLPENETEHNAMKKTSNQNGLQGVRTLNIAYAAHPPYVNADQREAKDQHICIKTCIRSSALLANIGCLET